MTTLSYPCTVRVIPDGRFTGFPVVDIPRSLAKSLLSHGGWRRYSRGRGHRAFTSSRFGVIEIDRQYDPHSRKYVFCYKWFPDEGRH